MTQEEKRAQLANLLLEEREAKKHLNCLQRTAVEFSRSVRIVLEPLSDCNIDFAYVRKTYSKIETVDVGDLIGDIEAACECLAAAREQIRLIENP